MVLILLEALGALLALVLIVWWTMFSGRRNGELPDLPDAGAAQRAAPPPGESDSAASHDTPGPPSR
ncbi:MAG: hypothetical protein ABI434_12125 [Burkholderiaceae bacterium]